MITGLMNYKTDRLLAWWIIGMADYWITSSIRRRICKHRHTGPESGPCSGDPSSADKPGFSKNVLRNLNLDVFMP